MIRKQVQKNTPEIIIYTDGSSLGNPGPGGYGCVIVFQDNRQVQELGGGDRMTTNNKMELTAIIESLKYLKKQSISTDASIIIRTDSSYAINGITKWIHGWKKKNWITSTKQVVLNVGLWQQLDELCGYYRNITWEHVRGHVGIWGNERCDTIATSFSGGSPEKLYSGSLDQYNQNVLQVSQGVSSKKPKSSVSSKKTGKAYSYVSLVGGVIEIHSNWEECNRRVTGKNAKFKKVFSEQEEKKLIEEWNRLS